MKDIISIIVPVYNVSEYVGTCLDSLLRQTYQNVEIIVIDDGSTDNSGRICDQYAEKYSDKIKVIHTENHGLSAARNVGLKAANGKYLAFVDSDDWIEEEMCEILLENLNKSNADISSCGVKQDFNNGKDLLNKVSDSQKCNQRELAKEIIKNQNVYGYVCNKLFKKSMLDGLQFDETLMSCEDIDFTVRYIENCKFGVYTVSELYHYRQRRGSMTGEFNYNPRKLSVIKAYEKIMPIYEQICPECMYILLKNYLKINLNILGRMKCSHYQNVEIERMLLKNIQDTYSKVIKDKRNPLGTRINIVFSRKFPGVILGIKQIILKRKYK